MITNAIESAVGDPKVVSDGLSFPTSLTFSPDGTAYVAESGLPFGGAPRGGRVWHIGRDGARSLLVDGLQPPVNGLVYHDDALIVSGGDQPGYISRLDLDGRLTPILSGLPGPGNYHTNMVVVGPDEKLYFSQGALTNMAVVGLDAYELGWLRRLPHANDVPGLDIVLAGGAIETEDPLQETRSARARTGAFSQFGSAHPAGTRIKERQPELAIVILTAYPEEMAVRSCLKAGASACLFKDVNEQSLLSALIQVVHGRAVIDPRIAGAMLPRRGGATGSPDGVLTGREHEVLLLIARGLTTQEIAEEAGLSPNTVKSHTRSLFNKLDAHNRVQALAVAKERALL